MLCQGLKGATTATNTTRSGRADPLFTKMRTLAHKIQEVVYTHIRSDMWTQQMFLEAQIISHMRPRLGTVGDFNLICAKGPMSLLFKIISFFHFEIETNWGKNDFQSVNNLSHCASKIHQKLSLHERVS